ncbi:hypothetical protein BBP40_003640 [Aspergillus hancockii]|nr:hypothetical protein BBP40_003640 [Aspergillus hancockii]
MQFYPKARQRRLSISHPTVRRSRLQFLKLTGLNFVLLQLLFLALFSYLFGSLFRQTDHIHNINVVFVDYDGGLIGTAVRRAYQQLEGEGFPTLIERSPQQFESPTTLQSAVCNIDYWAAIYTTPDASNRLATALTGGAAASSYNQSDVLIYIWNEARYSTVADSAVAGNLDKLSQAARIAYSQLNGTGALQTLPATDVAAVEVFTSPWTLTSVDIQPTIQGSRLIYNTLVFILILIQDFFFLGTVNGLYAQLNLWIKLSPKRMVTFRLLLSAAYTFIGSLCATGSIWAFRKGWHVNGNQFVLTWMAIWLFGHLNFLTLDVFTVWLPPPFVPMALITWIVLNVTSILLPFELSPAFYQWAYALPAHALYQILIDIWSGGCNPQLDYALPVLFAYELSSLLLSCVGVYRRSHLAFVANEGEEKKLQECIAATLAEREEPAELEKTRSRREDQPGEGAAPTDEESALEPAAPMRRLSTIPTSTVERQELVERITRETSRLRHERAVDRGPRFDLVGE